MTHLFAAACLALSIVGNACQPPTAPPEPRSYVYGDSLGAQITSTPIEDGDGRTWRVESGAPLSRWADSVIAAFHAGPADVTLALGTNDAIKGGGWNADDVAVWSWVIMAREPDDRLTVVLPHVQACAELQFPGILENVERARDWLSVTLPGRTVDWRPVVETKPTIIAADCIHLAAFGPEVNEPVQARYGVVDEAARLAEDR
jgi:hypothetical protein